MIHFILALVFLSKLFTSSRYSAPKLFPILSSLQILQAGTDGLSEFVLGIQITESFYYSPATGISIRYEDYDYLQERYGQIIVCFMSTFHVGTRGSALYSRPNLKTNLRKQYL